MFPQEILIKLALRLGIVVAFCLSLYMGYAHVKQIGYKEAEQKYTVIIKSYENDVNKKIDAVVMTSVVLMEQNRNNNYKLSRDLQAVLALTKDKPLVVVKDGECLPSEVFSDTIRVLNNRANQSMKDSQK
jgi:hypothetical protein